MATPSDDLTREIVRLKDVKNWSWNEINDHYPDITKETLRSKYRRFIGKDGHKKKGKPTIKSEQRRNTATVESRAPRITTLEQLLGAADVDLDTWRVDRYIINKWEVGAKSEYKNLTWTSGVMDGSLRADGLTISPLFQVKAWLVRIKPVAIIPVIAPVDAKR